jgi:hypothetical protein
MHHVDISASCYFSISFADLSFCESDDQAGSFLGATGDWLQLKA